MTAKEIQKRSERAQRLRVLQTQENEFFVESAEGKILYRVIMGDEEVSCTCGDFARNARTDPAFRCKHLLAVDSCLEDGELENAQFLQKRKPKLDDRFIMEIEGTEFVKYPGLLDLGHQKGILKIEVDPIQVPTEENHHFAVCKATVISKMGETFVDVGDANPGNCNSRVSKHLLRMASTRAIARALRSFTNIGMTCLEELDDISDVIGNGKSKPQNNTRKNTPRKTASKPARKNTETTSGESGKSQDKKPDPPVEKARETEDTSQTPTNEPSAGPIMSEAQKRAIHNLSRRRGISVDELEKMVLERYDTALENLASKDASEFIRQLQQAA